MHPTQKQAVDTTATPATTLWAAARYLAKHGWIQGAYYDMSAVVFTPAACMVGAIGMVCYGGPVDAPAQMFDAPGFDEFEAALTWLDEFLTVQYQVVSYEFNDAKGRTADDVIRVLGEAANRWDHLAELGAELDAVNAAPAHADYPHEPGTLYDCPACESACFCVDDWQCLYCASSAVVRELEDGQDATGGVL